MDDAGLELYQDFTNVNAVDDEGEEQLCVCVEAGGCVCVCVCVCLWEGALPR
jgi:hypothetical protein